MHFYAIFKRRFDSKDQNQNERKIRQIEHCECCCIARWIHVEVETRLGFPRHCSTAASRRRCAPWLQPRYHQKLTAIYASATLKVYKGNCFRDELSFLLHSYIQARDHVAFTQWIVSFYNQEEISFLSIINHILKAFWQ